MAATTYVLYSSQAVANPAAGSSSTCLYCNQGVASQAAITLVHQVISLHVQVTVGTVPANPNAQGNAIGLSAGRLRIKWAATPFTFTASTAPNQLYNYHTLDVELVPITGNTYTVCSPPVIAEGPFVWAWVDIINPLQAPLNINATFVECND